MNPMLERQMAYELVAERVRAAGDVRTSRSARPRRGFARRRVQPRAPRIA